MELTAKELRRLFRYEPETGEFIRLVSLQGYGCKAGMSAGSISCINGKYRWTVQIHGRQYYRYRLAWLYVHGTWPSKEIDHINGDSSDDRFANLREATRSQNSFNMKRRKTNKLMKGVGSRDDTRKKFYARINTKRKKTTIGWFDTEIEAHQAYLAEAKTRFGEFARGE